MISRKYENKCLLLFLVLFFNSIEIRVFSSCKQMNSPLRKDNIARSVKDEKRFKISISKVKISSALSRLNSPTYTTYDMIFRISNSYRRKGDCILRPWYLVRVYILRTECTKLKHIRLRLFMYERH